MQRKTPEHKKMMGDRMMNSDGFTYVYGAAKHGVHSKPATHSTRRSLRNDKRSVKQAENKRIKKETDDK